MVSICFYENLVFKNVVLRHWDDLKLKKIKSENDFHLNLPSEVAEKLFQLTSDDILSNFSFHKKQKTRKNDLHVTCLKKMS